MSGSDLKQRLAAILAADAAGYSRLMAGDERATVAALDAARAIFRSHIESSQGRVIDMAGDSVLAVFETATGAVSAALAVQQQLAALLANVPDDRRMRFRIGLHLGDVMEKADGTIYGDGVNIAARLEGLAEPGGITVSESIRTAVKGKVSAAFEDQGEQTVKNIAEPVRAYRVKVRGDTAKPSPALDEIALALPDKPSIAVLPFTNMSGDPEQEYFTDGITEDIITELSRFHSLFVIARNSSFTYKGKAVDVRTVAKELGVRYVLEGSIRRSANRIRVTAQLIDALTGTHIWAEKYDRVLEDIFAVQEELTQSIVGEIAPRIDEAESVKVMRRRPENLSAYEMAVRAAGIVHEAYLETSLAKRIDGLRVARAALEVDPRSVLALDTIAWAHFIGAFDGSAPNPMADWEEGIAAANREIAVDPANSRGYTRKAALLMYAPVGDHLDAALANLRRALELNRNDAQALSDAAIADLQAGRPKPALDSMSRAIRLSPRDTQMVKYRIVMAAAYFMLKDYAHAREQLHVGYADAPDHGHLDVYAAVVHVGLGEIDAARQALASARRRVPVLVQRRIDGGYPCRDPEIRHRFIRFLRVAAGLEDPSAADPLR